MTTQPTQPAQPYPYRTLGDIKEGPIRALVFGPPKVGKTEFLLTWPNVAIADYDGDGVKVGNNPGFRARHGDVSSNVRFESFADPIDPQTGIFVEAVAFQQSIWWANKVLSDPWARTMGFDSLTALSVYARNAGLVASGKRNRSKTLAHAKEDKVLLMAMQDFGAEMSALEQLMDQLMVVKDKHIIILAHERQESTDAGMIVAKSPLITGDRLRAQIAKWFDEVWYLDSNSQGKRTLICQPRGVLKGVGSRLGLPPEIQDPSYKKVMEALGRKP